MRCRLSAKLVAKFLSRASSRADLRSRFKLKGFQKFDSAAIAVEEAASIIEGKVTPRLSSLLDGIKDEKKVSLAVADPKLGMSTE